MGHSCLGSLASPGAVHQRWFFTWYFRSRTGDRYALEKPQLPRVIAEIFITDHFSTFSTSYPIDYSLLYCLSMCAKANTSLNSTLFWMNGLYRTKQTAGVRGAPDHNSRVNESLFMRSSYVCCHPKSRGGAAPHTVRYDV